MFIAQTSYFTNLVVPFPMGLDIYDLNSRILRHGKKMSSYGLLMTYLHIFSIIDIQVI
jgi:hypothetical protein